MSSTSAQEMYCGLPVFPLRDVLLQLDLPAPFNAENVSSKWRCVLAPSAEASTSSLHATMSLTSPEELLLSEEALMAYLEAGIPARGHIARAAEAHAACGEDSVDWLITGKWNTFPKPQIALRRGWGAAGTDIQVSTYHKMIGSFREVFDHQREVEVPLTEEEMREAADAALPTSPSLTGEEAEEVLDLQLFHRADGCPDVPILGEQLIWPSYVDDGAVCDTATWVSQRGMVRHWHLNDSGEFAMQAALPLRQNDTATATETNPKTDTTTWLSANLTPQEKKMRTLLCPAMAAQSTATNTAEKQPSSAAMVAIFAPKGGYDWVIHDDESTVLGKVVAVDLFATPDEALPQDAATLPVLTVAVLESGGAPLIIPPNLAQMSIALRNCVVAEQRRVSNLWLDDVSYFLHRCARWQTNPMIYAYLQQDLQDDAFVAGQVIPFLIRVFHEHAESTAYHAAVRRRVVCSLLALTANEKHYGLSDGTRRSLNGLLRGGNEAMQRVLESAPYRTAAPSAASDVPATLEGWLTVYWNMSWAWPKAGCVLRVPNVVYPLGTNLSAGQQMSRYVPVVYPREGCLVVYGTEEDSLEGTVQQYFDMKHLEGRPKELMSYLRTRKQPPDDLLEELF